MNAAVVTFSGIWETRPLGILVDIEYGKSPSGIKRLESGVPIVGTGGVSGYTDVFVYKGPSIIFGRKGSIDSVQRSKGPFWAIDTTFYCKPKKEFDWSWLFYVVSLFDLRKLNEASGIPSLSRNALETLPIPVPSLYEQQKIAAILSSVDDKLNIIVKQIEATQTLKRGLMQTLFSRGVGTQDDNGRWVPHTEYSNTIAGELPCTWRLHALESLAEKITDGTHKTPVYTSEGIPFLRVTDIKYGNIDFSSIKYISVAEHKELIKRCKPEKGDVLLSKNGTIGVPREVDWDFEFSIFVSLCLIKVGPLLSSTYLTNLIESDFIKAQIKNQSKQGTVTNLHLEEIRKFLIPLPPLAEQRKIVEILNSVDKKIQTGKLKLSHYQTLKRGLMQKLLTGEWRVKVEASDSAKMADAEPELA